MKITSVIITTVYAAIGGMGDIMDFKYEVAKKIADVAELDVAWIQGLLEVPPEQKLGDFAFPCFQLAKTMRKAPPIIAKELLEKIDKGDLITDVQAVGGYLNFFLNKNAYMESVINDVLNADGNYGSSNLGEGKTVIVEFSSPNIAKPFHVGHLCSTVIGSSVEKMYKYLGYKTVRINHLGDWGTQFGKLISAWKKWGDEEALQATPIKELLRIYVKFHDEAQNNPDLENEGRQYFKKLEDGEEEAVGYWKRFMEMSLLEFKKIYDLLGIEFDSYNGESFYSDKMDEVVSILESKGLLEESQNARVVSLEELNIPPCIIVKSDGASIYATRDLAAAIYRKRNYDFDKCIYVVGTPQALHFKQVFSVLDKAGYEWAKDCVHIGFGLVKFADKKLSTRSGDVIFLEDVLAESVNKTRSIIEENNPNLEDKEYVAEKVGIGAIVYSFLKSGRERDMVFSWEDILDFEGESGPYVQYTYARGKSILRKADIEPTSESLKALKEEEEFQLVKLLEGFKEVVVDAANKYEPAVIARHVTQVARAFNKFYNTCPVLIAEGEVRNARILLTKATCSVIKSGLALLGIEVVEKM